MEDREASDRMSCDAVIDLLFTDITETYPEMKQIGEVSSKGYSRKSINILRNRFKKLGAEVEHFNLSPSGEVYSGLLIIRNGLDAMLRDQYVSIDNLSVEADSHMLFQEHRRSKVDTFHLHKGRVARSVSHHTAVFSDYEREPDYSNGQSRVSDYSSFPILSLTRSRIVECFSTPRVDLSNCVIESTFLYDYKTCLKPFTHDKSRNIIIGVRLCQRPYPLVFAWYKTKSRKSSPHVAILEQGDIYVLSEPIIIDGLCLKRCSGLFKTLLKYEHQHSKW